MLTPHGWLEVRTADGADHRRVAAVHRRCYPQEAWTASDVRRFHDRGRNVVKVMSLDDGRVIGSLLYRQDDEIVTIARVAVLPAFRACRVAAYAIRSLTGPTSPVQRGVYEARVHELNTAGIALMRMCGFDATAVDQAHFPDGRDAYVFRLFKEAPLRVRPLVRAEG